MKQKASLVLRIILLAALVGFEVVACFFVLRLNMLTPALVAVLILLCLVVAGVFGLLLFACKRGKQVGVVRMIIGAVLAVAVMAGCFVVAHMADGFYDAMTKITNTETPNSQRGVYVLKDNPAQTIADAAAYTFGTVSGYDESCTQQVVQALETELSRTVAVRAFASVPEMLDALYEKQVGAVILNSGYISILEEDSRYLYFSDETRELYTVPVVEAGKSEPPVIEPDSTPSITNTPFILYLSGQDGYAKNLTVTRSDVNILMVVNPNTKQILMINTPRDYYVVHPWGTGTRDKLTHCGIYGVDCSMEALELLYGIEIDHYAQINFNGFKKLIDALGGITVYSSRTFVAAGEAQIVKGENQLNGEQALCFARDRMNQPGGDNGRGQNQMVVMQSVINKVTSGTTLLQKYPAIFDSLDGMFATSVTMDEVGQLVRMQLTDMAQWDVQTFTVNGFGDFCTTYSVPSLKAYVMHPNDKAVEHAKTLIQRVMDGQTLTQADLEMPK